MPWQNFLNQKFRTKAEGSTFFLEVPEFPYIQWLKPLAWVMQQNHTCRSCQLPLLPLHPEPLADGCHYKQQIHYLMINFNHQTLYSQSHIKLPQKNHDFTRNNTAATNSCNVFSFAKSKMYWFSAITLWRLWRRGGWMWHVFKKLGGEVVGVDSLVL